MTDTTSQLWEEVARRADEERVFWDQHYAEYLDKYPEQFVAVRDGVVIAVSADLVEFEKLLADQGLKPTEAYCALVTSKSQSPH